ncbi:hypothetical protein LZ31DRAFT_205529 [Colletotrichum somersetense]|nr:hypothetical protein LZ31DRAFT_205529 [Colletotrichum somersetense]
MWLSPLRHGQLTKCNSEAEPVTTESCHAKATDSIRKLSELKEKCDRVHQKATSFTRDPASKSEWHDRIAPYQALLIATKSISISANAQVDFQDALKKVWECVRSFLKYLRGLLPISREGMIPLIITAQCRMDFFKQVPWLEGFGLNCLGDLAMYRMAVEADPENRDPWRVASERWYKEAKEENILRPIFRDSWSGRVPQSDGDDVISGH